MRYLDGPLRLRIPPPLFLIIIYATAIVLGAGALTAPFAQRVPVSFAEALFTATSAVTVTGLSVVDVGATFSMAGQAVIAVLVQLGGIGLMTFAVMALATLGMPVGLVGREYLREDLNQTSVRGVLGLSRRILRVALLLQLAGTAVLATVFVPQEGWGPGLWSAAFHAISAFNNAGFSLYADGLQQWVGEWRVNLTISVLFILGGLGYMVIADLRTKRRWRDLGLHAKLTLAGSAGLTLFGFVVIAALEWSNPQTLAGLPDLQSRLLASWFQAVTPRTAGFNTLEIDHMNDASIVVIMCLMAIGGGAASTAGGVKVTTFVVLLLATHAFLRRRTEISAFRRTIPLEEIFKVMAVVTMSLFFVIGGIFALTATHQHLDFLDLAFEVVSAFATVGLTHGLTAELDWVGRAVLMAEMFVGRVGPLTIGFFLATRVTPRVRYPQARVQFG